MYLLDTNVVSELRKVRTSRIDPRIAIWIDSVDVSDLYISAVTMMELEIGVLKLERRDSAQGAQLRAWLDDIVSAAFRERTLPFDAAVALICARLNVPDRQSSNDGMIAATALRHGMAVVTRNIADFRNTGARLIDPWT